MASTKATCTTGHAVAPWSSTSPGKREAQPLELPAERVKIVLTLPVVMALLGAEVELRLAPRLDVILTAAGICAIWA